MQISLDWGQIEEIREFCKGEIAHHKIPRHIQKFIKNEGRSRSWG